MSRIDIYLKTFYVTYSACFVPTVGQSVMRIATAADILTDDRTISTQNTDLDDCFWDTLHGL